MAALPIVIIHGWSDSSASFTDLANALRGTGSPAVTTIDLADWVSMDDEVTYDDVVTQMDRAWDAAGLPRTPHSVDVIVHSTGGLVIRDWLVRNFGEGTMPPAPGAAPAPTASPIYHLVMLAPANFGSPLAHKGTSFLGRILKGWNPGAMFQVGAKILKGLELGSTYSWNLAMEDRFGARNFYDKGAALATVIVGNTGWTGISSAANEPGTDGTVRDSTANMNCAYIYADMTGTGAVAGGAPGEVVPMPVRSVGKTGYLVLDGLNHSQVHDPRQPGVLPAVLEALAVNDAGFDAYCAALDAKTAAVLAGREGNSDAYYWGYQNAVFYVHDQFDGHVQDYFIEFYNDQSSNFIEELFHRKVLQDVHAFTDDAAFRAMLLDITTLKKETAAAGVKQVKISLTAQPDFQTHKSGYRTFNDQDIGAITLDAQQVATIFQANETVLVEMVLEREQRPEVFRFS